jgi:hypothetical protein
MSQLNQLSLDFTPSKKINLTSLGLKNPIEVKKYLRGQEVPTVMVGTGALKGWVSIPLSELPETIKDGDICVDIHTKHSKIRAVLFGWDWNRNVRFT